jgi:hypothetical protein
MIEKPQIHDANSKPASCQYKRNPELEYSTTGLCPGGRMTDRLAQQARPSRFSSFLSDAAAASERKEEKQARHGGLPL